ncbi:MAG: antitoxin VapB family protein [Nanoarchaeota archaeon]
MGSVNIAIKDEAYEFLSSLRKKNESFSEIILNFKNKKKGDALDLLKFFDNKRFPRPKVDWKDKEERMKDFRESFDKRAKNDRD